MVPMGFNLPQPPGSLLAAMGAVRGVGSVQPGALGHAVPPPQGSVGAPRGQAVLDHCSSAVQQLKEKQLPQCKS